jgi:hypothetical protein
MQNLTLLLLSLLLIGCDQNSTISGTTLLQKSNSLEPSIVQNQKSAIDVTQSNVEINTLNGKTYLNFSNPTDAQVHQVPFVFEEVNEGEVSVIYAKSALSTWTIEERGSAGSGLFMGTIKIEASNETEFLQHFSAILHTKGIIYAEPNYQKKEISAVEKFKLLHHNGH